MNALDYLLKPFDYNEFLNIYNKRLKEETIFNEKVGSTTKRYILFHNDYPIGEVGIRTTINDYWENKGSQIFYKYSFKKLLLHSNSSLTLNTL